MALAANLIVIVTSRVVSPQYMIWLIGFVALLMVWRVREQYLACWLVLAATALTQVEYPFNFSSLIHYSVFPVILVCVRNVLLVAATVAACRALPRAAKAPSPAAARNAA